MTRPHAMICSICKEDHALVDHGAAQGGVCVCDRCLETVARENLVWICLRCRQVYLESKHLFFERERDPETRRFYRDILAECVIQGLESCLHCTAERAFRADGRECELVCC